MENIEEIFLTAFKSKIKLWGTQARLAMETGISKQRINDILHERVPCGDVTRRKIAHAFGYSGSQYEEFLNIGRRELGLIKAEPEPAPIPKKMVTISLNEYNSMKLAIGSMEREREAHKLALQAKDDLIAYLREQLVGDGTEVGASGEVRAEEDQYGVPARSKIAG